MGYRTTQIQGLDEHGHITSILTLLNRRLVRQKWNVLLMDSVRIISCPRVKDKLLQPLDAGIVKSFKVHYRKHLHTTDVSASSNVKSVDNFRLIKQAWEVVSPDTELFWPLWGSSKGSVSRHYQNQLIFWGHKWWWRTQYGWTCLPDQSRYRILQPLLWFVFNLFNNV